MKPTSRFFRLLAATAVIYAVPAIAQQTTPASAPERKINISRGAQKAVMELQEAVKAGDSAVIATKVAAANAAAKTNEDRFYIANLQMRAGIAAKDNATIAAGIEAMINSGAAEADQLPMLYANLGKTYSSLKQDAKAEPALVKAIELNPNDVDATALLAELRNRQGNTAEAVKLIQKAIAIRTAAGQKVEENWYRRGVALAFNAKLPESVSLSREWAKTYPTAENWRDAIRIYRRMMNPDETTLLDMFRLGRATKSLNGDSDFYEYAALADRKGFPGEAKAVLQEGTAAGLDASQGPVKDLLGVVTTKSQGDRESLAASAAKAKAAAAANSVITVADAYYGYGDYAQAVDLYRTALTKSGADANVVNLKLGMALARSGDKAGATAALNTVTGPRAELAKLWLAYLSTQA